MQSLPKNFLIEGFNGTSNFQVGFRFQPSDASEWKPTRHKKFQH